MTIVIILLILILIAVLWTSEKGSNLIKSFSLFEIMRKRDERKHYELMNEMTKIRIEDRKKLDSLFSKEDAELIKDISVVGHISPNDYIKIKEQIDIYHKFKSGEIDIRYLNNIDWQLVSYIKEEKVNELKSK